MNAPPVTGPQGGHLMDVMCRRTSVHRVHGGTARAASRRAAQQRRKRLRGRYASPIVMPQIPPRQALQAARCCAGVVCRSATNPHHRVE